MEFYNTSLFGEATTKAYYRFSSGALTTDSKNSHTLTAISDPAETTGKFDGGVLFDANDAYSAVDHADFKPTTAFSIGAWVKINGAADYHYLFQSQGSPANKYGIQFYTNITTGYPVLISGKGTGTTANTDYKVAGGNTNVCDNAWHLVVATWDTSNLKIYVDEAQSGSDVAWANAPAYSTNYVRLGAYTTDGSAHLYFINGAMDDFFLCNGKALSLTEVKTLYNNMRIGSLFFAQY